MARAKPNATAARIITSPAEEDAPPAIDGAYSPVRASRPNEVTATPAKAHCPIGRGGPRGVAGEPPSDRVSDPLPIIRAMNVAIEWLLPAASSAGRRRGGCGRRGRRGPAGPAGTAAGGERTHRRGDVAAGRGDQPPLGAEPVAALAGGHPRTGVAGEVVKRVA